MAIDSDRLLAGLPPAAIVFFATFARFEHALKRAGFCKDKEIAEPDWDRFANVLGATFFDRIRNAPSAATLFSRPPNRQVTRDHRLEWDEVGVPKNVQELFGAICRVRNNLFHGGKFSSGVVYDVSRDNVLLSEALWSLEQALDHHAELREHFHSWPGF